MKEVQKIRVVAIVENAEGEKGCKSITVTANRGDLPKFGNTSVKRTFVEYPEGGYGDYDPNDLSEGDILSGWFHMDQKVKPYIIEEGKPPVNTVSTWQLEGERFSTAMRGHELVDESKPKEPARVAMDEPVAEEA